MREIGVVWVLEKNITAAVYDKITSYANQHNLKIVSVSRVEDGRYGTAGASVIFEK